MGTTSASIFQAVVLLLAVSSGVYGALTSLTLPSDPNAAASWYTGSSIATSGTVIAAGAPGADTSESTSTTLPTGSGTGYVALYNCPGGVATACAYTGQIAGPSTGSLFGATVVLLNSGGFLAVGAPGYSSKAGYVAMYSLVGGALSTTINSFAPGYGSSELGFSLAGTMSGTTLWVFAGAPVYGSTSGAGDCSISPCGTVVMYVCTVSGTTYSCPSQTAYLFNQNYDNDGYSIAAAVVSSGVVGVVSVDVGTGDIYVWGCSSTTCGSASSGGSISYCNVVLLG